MRTIPRTAGAGFIGATVVNYLREKYPENVFLIF
jgi:dTDP-D-glucose 4,6-dehydratase